MFDIRKKIFMLTYLGETFQINMADQMTTRTTVSWIYLKTVEMLFLPSRADQVPQTFRFLRLYNYINHVCQ